MSNLTGITILVTGASSGIGQALSRMLLDRGATVLGVTRRPAQLVAGVIPLQADLTKREEIQAMFQQLGQIAALVNCAGVAYLSRIIDGNPADWEEMWRVNVFALTLCCQLSLRHFPREGGRIVNISSMSGHRVPPTGGFYSPTKFAVRAISDALRLELKAANSPVQVSCVSPGFVDTPLLELYFRGREDVLRKTKETMAMLAPEDVARAIMTILEAPPHVEIGDILMRSADQRM
ncbi:SDR family oxidoreductase [Luteolibacter luteus]|uniref:SDR family NAD(P)-dependent oxidoreductase n=1 Tax=Luteolibacter luteus TaxID=2728835 RepID=A0A858RCM0_9BACT|nr:SDR family NAD(P)-dependent oxidoreductase [Luteolibacter luteus]QJE94435.1 SDR family NAD(P)-dependent oxidoreductase [Luteolibacter luteus]